MDRRNRRQFIGDMTRLTIAALVFLGPPVPIRYARLPIHCRLPTRLCTEGVPTAV